MRKARRYLTRLELTEAFDDVGNTVRWKISRKAVKAGRVVTGVDGRGYLCFVLNGVQLAVHRALWVMREGPIPEGMYVDHIDGDKLNNLPGNLRLATPAENNRNRRMNRNNTSGHKNVTFNKISNKWQVQICNGVTETYFGSFSTAEEAGEAAKVARASLHKEFHHHG